MTTSVEVSMLACREVGSALSVTETAGTFDVSQRDIKNGSWRYLDTFPTLVEACEAARSIRDACEHKTCIELNHMKAECPQASY